MTRHAPSRQTVMNGAQCCKTTSIHQTVSVKSLLDSRFGIQEKQRSSRMMYIRLLEFID